MCWCNPVCGGLSDILWSVNSLLWPIRCRLRWDYKLSNVVINFLLTVKYETFLFLWSCYLCSAILQFIDPSKQVLSLVTCISKGDPQTAFKLALILQAFNHMWLFITGTCPSLFMICTVAAGSTKGLCKLDHITYFYLWRVLFICRLFLMPFVDMWNRFKCNTTKALVPPNSLQTL